VKQIFIAWSGQRGKAVASALHSSLGRELIELRAQVQLVFSPESKAGTEWRKLLIEEQLPSSSLLIVVIEPTSLTSSWVGLEAGVVYALRPSATEPRILPVILTDALDSTLGTPFEMINHVTLSPTGTKRILEAVLSIGDVDPGERALKLAVEIVHNAMAHAWEQERIDELASHHELMASIQMILSNYVNFGLLTPDDRARFDSLCGRPLRQDVFEELADIVRLIRSCMAAGHDEDFRALSFDWAFENLIKETRQHLDEIDGGRVPVRDRSTVRDFWLNSVFGRARSSIWTTNFAELGENMGNTATTSNLAGQRDAIKRGVNVTRLFVYNPDMKEEEAERRRSVMREQLAIGITILVVSEAEFKLADEDCDAVRRIGSKDFMIIDGKHLYITTPGKEAIQAELISGQRYPARLKSAKQLQADLLGRADQLNNANIDAFPKVNASELDVHNTEPTIGDRMPVPNESLPS
jgi:hypothetical protein